MTHFFLCNFDELAEYQPRSFSAETQQGTIELLLIKQHKVLRAYLNHCPHLGIPLNWQPDEFLSLEGTHIQCSTHGALFTMEEGDCIAGPCIGQGLTSLPVHTDDNGDIYLVQN
jgi:nitrite reductase/ring-hydroxylating ferredoxin subunit